MDAPDVASTFVARLRDALSARTPETLVAAAKAAEFAAQSTTSASEKRQYENVRDLMYAQAAQAAQLASQAVTQSAPSTETCRPSSGGSGGGGGDGDGCPSTFEPEDRRGNPQKPFGADIEGMEYVVDAVRLSVVNPVRYRSVYERLGARPLNVLLYGPGGTGKTMIAREAARATGAHFYPVTSGQIMSKWAGTAEKCIEAVIREANEKARSTPDRSSIVMFDEADALFSSGSASSSDASAKVIATFKQVVQGPDAEPPSRVIIFAITNQPWLISDDALQRRFPIKLYVGLPDPDTRLRILSKAIAKIRTCEGRQDNDPLGLKLKFDQTGALLEDDDDDVRARREKLTNLTALYTPAELNIVARQTVNLLGLSEIDQIRFIQTKDGKLTPAMVEETKATEDDVCPVLHANPHPPASAIPIEVAIQTPDKICFRPITYDMVVCVLGNTRTRIRNTNMDTLEKFRDYASKFGETETVKSIEKFMVALRNISEITAV